MTTSSTPPDDTVSGHFKAGISELGKAAGIAKKKPGQGLSVLWNRKWKLASYAAVFAAGAWWWGGDSEPVRVVVPTADIGASTGEFRKIDDKKKTEEPTYGTTFKNTFAATTKPQTDACGAWLAKDKDGTEFVIVNLGAVKKFPVSEFRKLGETVDKPYTVGENVRGEINCDINQAPLYAFPRHAAASAEMGPTIYNHFQTAIQHAAPGQLLFSKYADCGGPRSVVQTAQGQKCSPEGTPLEDGETRLDTSYKFIISRITFDPKGKKNYKDLQGVVHVIGSRELYPGP